MGNAIITFKIMPESPEVDFEKIKEGAIRIGKEFGAKGEMRAVEEPLAFGLKSIKVLGMYEVNDDLDSEKIAEEMNKIEGVQTAEVENMDLAMG